MLTIVEHQHELLRAERVRDAFGRYRTSRKIETEGCCHGGRDKTRIRQRRELNGPYPIGKSRQQASGYLKAEPGLADATGPSQGDEAVGGAEVQDLVSSASRPISSETGSGRFVGGWDTAGVG
jgi:hypothetical protein